MSRAARLFRSFSPQNWRLRWKVAVLLCLPVIAASLFGASRVTQLVEESRHYAVQSEQMAVLPALTEFSTSVAGAAAATVLSLPPEPGVETATQADIAIVELLQNSDLEPQVAAALTRSSKRVGTCWPAP